jgi:RHS repeat-associated protein
MKLYVNGQLASQTNTTIRPIGALIPGDSPGLGIGNVNDGFNNFPFTGDIDEISLYNRALTAGEIQSIYNVGIGGAGKCTPTSPTNFPPSITQQPANLTITYGQSAVFSVQASGTAPLQYQWKRSGTNIPGATASFYFVPKPQVADSGAVYSVIVSNAWGTATSSNATLTVAKAPLTILADNKARLYRADNPPLTWSAQGFVYGESAGVLGGQPTLSTTATNTSIAGTYPITIATNTLSAANYYFILQNGLLSVAKVPLAVTANNLTRSYGATNPTLTWTMSGFVNGETTNVLSGAPQISTVATNNSPVGTYPIVITAGTLSAINYSFVPLNGTLMITAAPLTVTANNTSRIYGSPNPVFTASYNGFMNGETVAVLQGAPVLSSVGSNSSVGTYVITNTIGTLQATNYSFVLQNGWLTNAPAVLTVKADDKIMYLGDPIPQLTWSCIGLVLGDTTNVLNGAPALSTVGSVSTTNNYTITNKLTGVSAVNYTLIASNGILTVQPPSSQITFSTNVMNYLIGAPPMVMDANMTVTNKGTTSFSGAKLTARFVYGEADDHLSVLNLGTAAGQVGVTNASGTDPYAITYGTGGTGLTNIGTFTPGNFPNDLVVHFGTNATLDHVRAVARNITFCSTSRSPSGNWRHVRCWCTTTNGNPAGTNDSPASTNTIVFPCPTNICAFLIIDRTPSMGTVDMGTTNIYGSNRLAAAKAAAISFLGYMQFPTDTVSIVTFSDRTNSGSNPILVTNFCTDRIGASNAIATLVTNNNDGTIYYPSLQAAYTNLAGLTNPLTLRLTIFLSDGEENGTNYGAPTSIPLALGITHAMATNGVPGIAPIRLITIGVGGEVSKNDSTGTNARALLMKMASSTNDFYISTNGTGLASVYNGIASSICRVTNQPPGVYAGPDTTNVFGTLPGTVQLAGSSWDDGLPRNQLTNLWLVISNPPGASVTFSNATVTNTTATFSLPGTYTLQLVASDTELSSTDTVNITIQLLPSAPTVLITNPRNNDTFNAPAAIKLMSIARDLYGVVTNVNYYLGTNGPFLGSSTTSPYLLTTNLLRGNYQFVAVAWNDRGLSNTSPAVNITVLPQPPVVTITAPQSNAVFSLGEPIVIQAIASDVDGVVTNVQFRAGNSVLGNDTNAPYSIVWTGAQQSLLTNLYAIATDNDGLTATSSVPITVNDGCPNITGVSNLVLSVSEILGGGQLTGTVILSNAVPNGAGGQVVNLYSTNPAVIVPPSVYVPEGQRSNSFTISTLPVSATSTFTISASYQGQTAKTANLVVDLWPDGSTNAVQYCGPMDVVFAIDTTGSMEDVLDSVKNSLTNTLNSIVMASLGDYRIGLVTFDGYSDNCINGCGFYGDFVCVRDVLASTNRDQIANDILNLQVGDGYGRAECSDEALNTVINTLSATDPNRNQCGDFTTPFRPQARKIIILVTDAEPGSFQDYYNDTVQSNAFERAAQAVANGIEISAVNVDWYNNGIRDQMMHYYADTTGGVYAETPDGSQAGQAIKAVLAQCGTSQGRVIFVRDDQSRHYVPFTATGPQLGAAASVPAAFDTRGVWGNVLGVRLQRAGSLQTTPGSRFDLELGVSALTNVASSFGLLYTNAHKLTGTNHYSIEWELPTAFYPDAGAQLNGSYSLLLSNRVSSVCGQAYSATDTPEAGWPWDKNILTLAVAMDRQIPQGRCRDFVLANGDSPQNGTWDITLRDQVIASSGQPNGWDVEDDHTAFSGFIVTVPTKAVTANTYQVRVRLAGWPEGRSTPFEVLSAGAILSSPVLLPLVLSTNLIASPTTLSLTVSLDAPAPFGDAYVPIYTNGAPCAVVVIPAGQTTATTNIQASGSNGSALEISASYNGCRKAKARFASSCVMPDSPVFLCVANGTNNTVLLIWTNTLNITSYTVNRGLVQASLAPIFTGLATNRFMDTDVMPNTTYYYSVTAFNNWCTNVSAVTNFTISHTGSAPAPWIIPFGGIYNDQKDVLLTNYVPGTVMFYTTNGSTPSYSVHDGSFTNGMIVHLVTNTTIKAYTDLHLSDGVNRYDLDSRAVSASFTIVHPTPINCGSTNLDALTYTNAWSPVDGEGYFCRQYVFHTTAGKQVTITGSSDDFITWLYLKDSPTNVLDWSYYLEDSYDSHITYLVPKTGDYIIEVNSYWPYEVGNFSVNLECQDTSGLNVFTNACVNGNTLFTTNSARLPIGGLIDFGVIKPGMPVTNYVTLTNSGNASLVISNIVIAPAASDNGGNGFTISPTNVITLPAGGIANLAVSLYATNWWIFTNGCYFYFFCNDPNQDFFYAYISGEVKPSGPPWVNIDYPLNNMAVPATNSVVTNVVLEIDAEAMDEDGIQKVEFYTNGVLFQTVANVPYYTIYWTNPPAGQQIISAKASDKSIPQQYGTNSVTIMVGMPTLTLSPTNPCVGLSNTTFTITATLRDATNGLVSGSNVVFTVTGAHNLTYTTATAAGQASFTYTGTNAGLDIITATAAVSGIPAQSDPVLKNWAKPISCGNVYFGALTNTDGTSIACGCAVPSHYTDFYSINGSANDFLIFKMASTNFSTFMFLMNTNCTTIAVTNEMLNLNDTQMRVTLPSNSTYIVEATSADIFKTGNYSLSVTCNVTPTAPKLTLWINGTNIPNYGRLDLGTTTNGTPITWTLGLTNAGNAPLNLTNYSWYYGQSNVFSVTLAPGLSLNAGTGTNFTLQFLATNSGRYLDALALTNNDPYRNPFYVNLTAVSIHDGLPPTVAITAPTNNAWFYAPASINIQATATNTSGAAITNVVFIFRIPQNSTNYLIGNDTARPYSIDWGLNTPGGYDLLAVAYDNQGGIAVSAPVTNVQVRLSNTNHPPKANTDIVTVFCNSRNNLLNVLTNDTDPDGDPLTIIDVKLSKQPGPRGAVKIVDNGKRLSYTPVPGYGTNDPNFIQDGFSYEISDGKGGTNWGGVYVIIFATPMPHIQITNPPPNSTIQAGTTNFVKWTNWPAESVSNIVRVEFYNQDDMIGEVTNAPFTSWPWLVRYNSCQCGLKARVIDKFGQYSEDLAKYNIVGATDPNLPVPHAVITSPAVLSQRPQVLQNATSIEQNAVITDGILVVTGSVYQDINSANPFPVEYKVLITTADGTILRDSGWLPPANIQKGPIYTNDLTTLQNDSYKVELIAQNDYQITSMDVPFLLNSGLKLGVFTFSEQDLVIPAGGTPLSVIRTYNSMNPNPGDFGYSWTYALQELNVAFHEDREFVRPDSDDIDDTGPAYNGAYFSVRESGSRDITLTLPNGQRTTFYYYEAACDSLNAYACSYYYAPPEAHAQLRPVDANGNDLPGVLMLINGYYVWPSDGGDTPYDNYDFPAFILKLDDGTEYFIVRDYQGAFDNPGESLDDDGEVHAGDGFYYKVYTDKARVAWIKLPSGEKIVINSETAGPAGGQFSVDYFVDTNKIRSIYFQRNADGQISAIMDPASGANGLPVVKYEYDSDTNLIRVLKLTDRNAAAYATNTYLYENGNFPHYLTKILDPRGVALARNLFDDTGKLIGVIDANGKTNLFFYDLTGQTETVFDRLGNRMTYGYDTHGNVTTEIDALNHVTQNTYDDQNNLTSTTDALNHTTRYAYDSKGNRTNVVDALGHTSSFLYDLSTGNLLTHTDPVGNLTVNTYDDAGNLISTVQKDPQGKVVGGSSSTYQDNRLVETRDINGITMATFAYDASGNLTNTTDANGAKRYFSYDANGNQTSSSYIGTNAAGVAVPIVTTNVYDAAGRVTMTIDALGNTNRTFYNAIGKADYTIDRLGNTNRYLYDARGNLIQTISPFGTTRTVFDDNARPILAGDANGISGTLTEYDAVGRVTRTLRATNVVINLQPDPNNPGQTNSVVGSYGVPYSTNSTEYYDNGWVKSRTGPDGQTTRYEYWADGQTMSVTDPLNNQTSYYYDDAGRQTQVWDALTHPMYFGYDALGRQVTTTFADGSSITNEYNLVSQRVGQVDQAGLRTQFGYNISGSLTNVMKPQVPDPENNNYPVAPQWNYQYDEQGHLLVITDPKGRSTTNSFDELGRQFTQRLPVGQTNLTQYNSKGQLWKQHDFKGQTMEYRYDQYGRTTNKYYFVIGETLHPSNSVAYYYNALGQLTNITELSGAQAGQGYAVLMDPSNNLLAGRARHSVRAVLASLNNHPNTTGGFAALLLCAFALSLIPSDKRRLIALGLVEAWRAQLLSLSAIGGEGRGEVARFRHHLSHSPSSILHPRRLRMPSLLWRSVAVISMFALLASEPGFDQLWTARAACDYPQNLSGDTTRYTNFTYDFDGHLTQVNCPEGVINYGYDLATGRHLSTCTTNSYVEYGYDELGRLQTVHVLKRNNAPVDETTRYTYDAVGNRSSVQLPNGIVTTYLYDSLNRLTNLTQVVGTTNLASYSYTLHPTGRRTGATEILRQEDNTYLTNTLTWQYDGMYRLTNEVSLCSSATYSYTNAFQYDLAGNRLKQIKMAGGNTTTTTNLYNDNDHLLREVTLTGSSPNSTNNYTYDLNGSVVGKTNIASTTTTTLYAYNLANKLSSVSGPNGSATYEYNDQGIRVRTMSGGNTTYYLVDANNHTGYAQVLEELNVTGGVPALAKSYVLGDDVLAQAAGSTASYLLYDGHGSTRQVIDNTLKVASKYNYTAYGETMDNSYNVSGTSLCYCGEQYDSTLQMYNLRARYYSPDNGRFNQRDTFEGYNDDPQTLHKYLYCGDDPVNGIDPSGRQGLVGVLVAIACIAIIAVALVQVIGFLYAGYTANADKMAAEPYKSWINTEAKAAGIEPRFLAAILATEIQDRGAIREEGNYSNYGDIWGSIIGDASVGLGQVKPSTAENILHYGHLRSALALWNRQTNIHVAAQYIKSLIDAANDINAKNPGFQFCCQFVGVTNMTLAQYSLPMTAWDDAHKKLLAQQYTQVPWRFDPNAKYGYVSHLSGRATAYYDGFWENYTSSDFESAFP